MRNLIFVGLPGSGKSTVGRLCAKDLGLPFVDADKFLEQREGRSVADIFASSGEGYFRDLESRVLAELCRREGIVLATGGGAILRRENRRLLRDGGLVIFLDRSPWAIRRTLRQQGRPLLTDDGAIFRLARQRRDLYRAAGRRHRPQAPGRCPPGGTVPPEPTARQAAEEAVRLWREEQT